MEGIDICVNCKRKMNFDMILSFGNDMLDDRDYLDTKGKNHCTNCKFRTNSNTIIGDQLSTMLINERYVKDLEQYNNYNITQ